MLALAVLLLVPASAHASRANVAALQSALTRLQLYKGFVDGIRGPLTRSAVARFQRRRGLTIDGVAGPQTRHALGRYGRPRLGSRVMRLGNRGWDVAALQYLLQRRGYGPGIADGIFGGLTQAAVVRAQSAARIGIDGLAGRQTIRSLRGHGSSSSDPGPGRFLRPVPGRIGDGFGAPRAGGRRHQGVDFPVGSGTRIGAAGTGTTIFAGRNYGGYGNLVVVQHTLGYTTWYTHMSSITSWVGERVSPGTRLGYVGSTGYSTGPHLHFEIRRYNTPVNPVPLLTGAVASSRGSAGGAHARETSECSAAARAGGAAAPRGSSWIARERLCARR
jgi:murein DD-endopeptidase MepM/ murein hydrolase activator NlpD